jgi:hypothetical protein
MAEQPFVEGNADAAKNQWTSIDEAMQIVAVADAQPCSTRRSANQAFRDLEIARRRNLQIPEVTLDELNVMPRLLGQRRFVGGVIGDHQRVAQHVDAKRLRRLGEINVLAWKRFENASSGVSAFDRIAGPERRDRRAVFDRRVNGAADQRLCHQRSRCVMNDDDIGMRRNELEGMAHGILAPLAARDDLQRLGSPAQIVWRRSRQVCRQRNDNRVNRGGVDERVNAPLKDGAPGEDGELFRLAAPEAQAAPARGNDRSDVSQRNDFTPPARVPRRLSTSVWR